MKKVITVGLVFLLLMAMATGAVLGEEAAAARSFDDAVLEWIHGLSLAEHGYEARAKLNGQAVSGSLQQQDGMLEIGLGTAGRVLVSEKELAYENGQQTFVLDLQSILKAVKPDAEKKAELQQDWQTLSELLTRILREVIQPSAQVSLTEDGIMVHLGLDERILLSRLKESLDILLQEEDAAELFGKYLPTLHALVPDIPEDVAALRELLAEVQIGRIYEAGRILNADLFIGLKHGHLKEVSCLIQAPLGRYDGPATLLLDFRMQEGGFVLKGKYDNYDLGRFPTVEFSAEMQDRQLNASVKLPWETNYSLNATWDPESGAFQAVYTPPESWAQVRVSGTVRKGALTATIYYCEDVIEVSFSGDERHGQFSLKSSTPVRDNKTYDIEARYYRIGRYAYRLVVTDKEYDHGYWGSITGFYLNCMASPDQIQFLYYPLLRPWMRNRGEASWKFSGDAFKVNLAYSRPYYYSLSQDFSVSIVKDGGTVKVGFAYPYRQFDVKGEASLLLGPNGLPQTLYGETSAGYLDDPAHPRDTTTLIWNPGFAAITGSNGVYRLERITDTEAERAWRLTVNADREMLIRTGLEDHAEGTALLISAEADGQRLAQLEIRPVEKKTISPVDREKAMVIDAQMLMSLIRMMR